MKAINVTYSVKSEFAAQNQQNVRAFIDDLAKINNPSLRYMAFLAKDGTTFNHMALYENDAAQKTLFELPSFQFFQKQRDKHGIEAEPKIEEIDLIAASFDFFQLTTA
jgi:hypothetical protein